MKVYVVQEVIDSMNSESETNILGVYDSKEKAQAKIEMVGKEIVEDNTFFLCDMFTEDYEPSDFDTKEIDKDGIHLYCDWNYNGFDVYYTECEVE